MGNDDKLIRKIRRASDDSAERVWQLPMYEEYFEQLKSNVADMKNSGGRLAGTIIAGWFLRKYVGDYTWAHLDIAAMDWQTKDHPYIPKGCTGFGVRLLIQLMQNWR
jgi:leucyl aminopeptidase